ncbi:hypothetical protein CEXT_79871 [Caerostris extrusa]|uniref:Uncharacterized protein n=1 Tax=Caerostris extrusa TaxID=172846 RepID=A0AAV4TFY2_CAEEX|nr:hypothetical protein CEXT_79871 [Caerostris extrusa]
MATQTNSSEKKDFANGETPFPLSGLLWRRKVFWNKLCLKVGKRIPEIAEPSVCFFSVISILDGDRGVRGGGRYLAVSYFPQAPRTDLLDGNRGGGRYLAVSYSPEAPRTDRKVKLYLDPLILHRVGQHSPLYRISFVERVFLNPPLPPPPI